MGKELSEQEKQQRKEIKKYGTPLEAMLEQKVQVLTTDGRIFIGILRGVDQALNCILNECEERVYSADQGVQHIKMGLYFLRGDNVALVGEIDDEIESVLDFSNIKANSIKPIIN